MITSYFGVPGCGKTTFATKLAVKELKRIKNGKSKYRQVYTNFRCKGCYYLDYSDLGNYFIEDSLIILDELTLDADNRDFKTFGYEKKQFFTLHRHMNNDIIVLTQDYTGFDKKIRDLCQELYFIKGNRLFSYAKKIWRQLDINDMTKDIVQGYRFSKFLELFSHRNHCIQFCLRPLYYKYFDSFELPTSVTNQKHYPLISWVDFDKMTDKEILSKYDIKIKK